MTKLSQDNDRVALAFEKDEMFLLIRTLALVIVGMEEDKGAIGIGAHTELEVFTSKLFACCANEKSNWADYKKTTRKMIDALRKQP